MKSGKPLRWTGLTAAGCCVLGVLLATFGFLKTFFILLLTCFGAVVGFCLDDFESVRKFVETTFEKKQ